MSGSGPAAPGWSITADLARALAGGYIGEVDVVPTPVADGLHRQLTGRGLPSWRAYYFGVRDAELSVRFGYAPPGGDRGHTRDG